jgi:hypothetical protein
MYCEFEVFTEVATPIVFWNVMPYSTVVDNAYKIFYSVTFEMNVLHNKFVGTKKRYAFYLSLNKKDFSLHL